MFLAAVVCIACLIDYAAKLSLACPVTATQTGSDL